MLDILAYFITLSCFSNTLYTAQFQFTGHSLDLTDNVLQDWLLMNNIIQCTALQSYASYKIEPLMDVIAYTVYIENSILLYYIIHGYKSEKIFMHIFASKHNYMFLCLKHV